MDLSESLGNLSHHAYALVGEDSVRLSLLSFLQREQGVSMQGNPDLFVRKYDVLTIDDARSLKDAHAKRPFADNGRTFFVLEIDSITHEAQNALLKMFEEPNEYARFFLVIPSEELLLPTLRSRLFMMHPRGASGQGSKGSPWDIAGFLGSSPAERIAFTDKLAADISDGKKLKTDALGFCAALSWHLRADGIEKNAGVLAAVAQTESYLRDRAPSIKQLLEHVALRCP